MSNYKKLLKQLIKSMDYYSKAADDDFKKSHFFNDLNKISQKSYDREAFILQACRDKDVVHVGFADSPYTKKKIQDNSLLHLKIKKIASSLYGIDVDTKAMNIYKNMTGDDNFSYYDLENDGMFTKKINKIDLILLGEILEHLPNPGIALRNLHGICRKYDAEALITVPNAFFLGGMSLAVEGYEGVHPHHYYYFTPVTVTRLLKYAGFKKIDIKFYHGATKDKKGREINYPGITKNGLIVLCK
jgi:hypothetical protein